MNIRNLLMPYVAQTLIGNKSQRFQRQVTEMRRYINNTPHTITFYHRINDPYSYLLLQAIPNILNLFDISLDIKVVIDLPSEVTPEPELLETYAIGDAHQLSEFHDLNFPENAHPPNREDCLLATGILLQQQGKANLLQITLEVTEAAWHFGSTTLSSCANRYGTTNQESTIKTTENHCKQLIQNGHYQSGMLFYGGEWFWGVDRLYHLAKRLNELKINKDNIDWDFFNKQYATFYDSYNTLKRRPKSNTTLDLYFSFRSPYSYIALERTFKMCEHYKIPLNIKPVLPMVMRGMTIPIEKRMYILKDAKREADKNEVPFGKVCDPIGPGVERCLAVYSYAQEQNKEKEFLLSICKGIWSEGIDVAGNGLGKLVERAGLNWPTARTYLKPSNPKSNDWKKWAEVNRQDLFNLGVWGVPSYHYGNTTVWGQDRLWAIEQAITNPSTL